MCACMLSHSGHVQLFVTLWTVARQAPLSMGFSKNTGVSCRALLQGIFTPKGLNRVSYVFLFYACFLKVPLHCLWALIISVKSLISLMIAPLEIMCLIGYLFLCFSDVLLWCIQLGMIFLFILLGAPWIYRLMCLFFFFSVLYHSWLFCFASALLCLSLASGNPVTCVLDFLFMSHVSFILLSVFSIIYFLS